MKKMKMLYGHMSMWEEKMREVHTTDSPNDETLQGTNVVENSLPNYDINRKKDEDFVYF